MKKAVKKTSAPKKAAPQVRAPVSASKAPKIMPERQAAFMNPPREPLKIIDETTTCVDCGAEFTEKNVSVLRSGVKFHVGCPKKGAALKKIQDARKHKTWCGVNGPTRTCNCAGRSSPPPPKKLKPAEEPDLGDMAAYVDDHNHVFLVLHIGQKIAVYTEIDPGGMTTYERRLDLLARELRPLKTSDGQDYPVLKVCEQFARAAVKYGATQGVLDHLARVVKLTPEEVEMAKNKKGGSTASAGKKGGGEKRDSAAAMFKELILEGKLTDDQIFAKVKAKFDLDDNKRGYVSWYRNNLRKQGKKVPDPVGGEKKAKAAPPKGKAPAKGKPAAKGKGKPSKKPAPKKEKASPAADAAPAETPPAT